MSFIKAAVLAALMFLAFVTSSFSQEDSNAGWRAEGIEEAKRDCYDLNIPHTKKTSADYMGMLVMCKLLAQKDISDAEQARAKKRACEVGVEILKMEGNESPKEPCK